MGLRDETLDGVIDAAVCQVALAWADYYADCALNEPRHSVVSRFLDREQAARAMVRARAALRGVIRALEKMEQEVPHV